MTEPFVRRAGSGPAVVCLHANASTSGQWRALSDRLAPRFTVLAVDSYGAGKSLDWPSDSEITLHDEVNLVEPVLRQADPPVVLVGHSYGAAVALIAALEHPDLVRALVLYEPTLFAVVDAQSPSPNDADGIRETVADSGRSLDQGEPEAAAERFIDYWMGDGSWSAMPPERRTPLVASVANVRRWGHALFSEPTAKEAFGDLDVPILYLSGSRTRASARAVARVLVPELCHVEHVELDPLGHMGPVTDPDLVNAEIERFLGGL